MKKHIIIMLLMLSMLFCVTAYADSDIEIYLFGNKVECDVAPVIENGRTLVPVRVISEEGLGADVEWDGEKRQVTIEKDDLSQLIRVVENRKVDGVIITRPLSVNSMEPLLRENGMPFVVIGKNLMPEIQLLIRKSTM